MDAFAPNLPFIDPPMSHGAGSKVIRDRRRDDDSQPRLAEPRRMPYACTSPISACRHPPLQAQKAPARVQPASSGPALLPP